nr:MAG TPA: hypothetical protein [Crassvirales sp.]
MSDLALQDRVNIFSDPVNIRTQANGTCYMYLPNYSA